MSEMIADMTGLNGSGNEVVPCNVHGFEMLVELFILTVDRLTLSMARDMLPISDEEAFEATQDAAMSLNSLMGDYRSHAEIIHRLIRKSAGGLN